MKDNLTADKFVCQLKSNSSYVTNLFFEHRYALRNFLIDELNRYNAGLVNEYNFPLEASALLISTFSCGYKLLPTSSINFVMRTLYSISEYVKNAIHILNNTEKFKISSRFFGEHNILDKRMYIWIAACSIDKNIRLKLIDSIFKTALDDTRNDLEGTYRYTSKDCGDIIEGHNSLMRLEDKLIVYNTYIDSIRYLENLQIAYNAYVHNLSKINEDKVEVYKLRDNYRARINDRIKKCALDTTDVDRYTQIGIAMSTLVSNGLNPDKFVVVFSYSVSTHKSSLIITNKSCLQKLMANIGSDRITYNSVYSNGAKAIICKCIKKVPIDQRDMIYTLVDSNNNTFELDRSTLKAKIISGEICCTNARIYRNGALFIDRNTLK